MASPYDVASAYPMQALPIGSLNPPQGSAYLPTPTPRAPMPDFSQVSTGQLSPFGHLGDVANQYIVNQQQKQQSGGLLGQILSQRFQPTDTDVGTAALRTATEHKYISPMDVASGNMEMQLKPYTEMAKIQSGGVEANGGATGALVSRLMTENPQMFPSAADALYFLKGGANQGLTSMNGQIAAMPGAPSAMGQVAFGKEAGKQGAELQYAAPIATAKTSATGMAENTVKAQTSLPQIQDAANYTSRLVNELITDPALTTSVGMASYMPVVRGTSRANFMSKLGQLQSQAFLEAFSTLRGGGQISNVEGEKATAALNRMSTAQDEAGFKQAGQDFLTIVNQATTRAKNAASGAPQAASTTPSIGGATHVYNPATGQLEIAQ